MFIKYTGLRFALLAGILLWNTSANALLICEEPLNYMLDTGLHPYLANKNFSIHSDAVKQFYQLNQQQLAWFHEGQLGAQGKSLLGKLNNPSIPALRENILATSQSRHKPRCQLSLYDTALTIEGLRHLQSMGAQPKLVETLLALSQNLHAEQQLTELEPDFPVYVQLQKALDSYHQLALDSNLSTPLPIPKESLHPDDAYPALEQLIYKLQRLGDLDTDAAGVLSDNIYAGSLVTAVERFQARHGLTVDGVLGKKTFEALNVPMSERVHQIELSLLRWRELPQDAGERMLVVNIPQYKLFAFERNQGTYSQTMEMRVIVGKSRKKHQTPVMSGEMTYIVFSPYWNIPYKILRDELHPQIIADPDYLTSKGYQIVSAFAANAQMLPANEENIDKLLSGELKLRQVNGGANALGSAKFMFPNRHAIYLHGTPAMSLFKRSRRNFSHGCVRLSDPAALAEYVLEPEQDWPRERIDELIRSGKRKVVSLSNSLPVYLMYATAAADADGTVYFSQDVYRLEQKLAQKLASNRVGISPGGY